MKKTDKMRESTNERSSRVKGFLGRLQMMGYVRKKGEIYIFNLHLSQVLKWKFVQQPPKECPTGSSTMYIKLNTLTPLPPPTASHLPRYFLLNFSPARNPETLNFLTCLPFTSANVLIFIQAVTNAGGFNYLCNPTIYLNPTVTPLLNSDITSY